MIKLKTLKRNSLKVNSVTLIQTKKLEVRSANLHKYQMSATLSTGHPNLLLVIRTLHFAKAICIDRGTVKVIILLQSAIWILVLLPVTRLALKWNKRYLMRTRVVLSNIYVESCVNKHVEKVVSNNYHLVVIFSIELLLSYWYDRK